MTKDIKCVVNATTGEQTMEAMTDEELAIDAATIAASKAKYDKMEADKAAATAKLAALGLTADDLKALGL